MDFEKCSQIASFIRICSVLLIVISFNLQSIAQAPNLGATSDFVLFTAAGAFNNVGASTVVSGDVGTNVGAFNAFPPTIFILDSMEIYIPKSYIHSALIFAIIFESFDIMRINKITPKQIIK